MKGTVEFPQHPHVLQVVIGAFQPDVEALKSISWLNETFDLIGWIEGRSSRLVGKVVVDNFIYSSEEKDPVEIKRAGDNDGMLTKTGKVQRLYYLRRI